MMLYDNISSIKISEIEELRELLGIERRRCSDLEQQLNFQQNIVEEQEKQIQKFAEMESQLSEKENECMDRLHKEFLINERRTPLQYQDKEQQFEKDELIKQLQQMESSAIELIMEKENKIQELQNTVDQLDQSSLKQHILELTQQIEQLTQKHHEQIHQIENEFNQRLLDSLTQENNLTQNNRVNLINQIHLLEQRIHNIEKELQDTQTNHKLIINNYTQQIQSLEQKNIQLHQALNKSHEIHAVLKRDYNSLDLNAKKLQAQLQDQINTILSQLTQAHKSVKNLTNQNQRLQSHCIDQQIQIDKLMQIKDQIHLNYEQVKSQLESQIIHTLEFSGHKSSFLSDQELKHNHSNIDSDSDSDSEQSPPQKSTLKEQLSDLENLLTNDRLKISLEDIDPTPPEFSGRNSSIQSSQLIQEKDSLIQEYETYLQDSEILIKGLQLKLQLTLRQMQFIRKNYVCYPQQANLSLLSKQNQDLKNHMHKLETNFLTSKFKWQEENSQLKDKIQAILLQKDSLERIIVDMKKQAFTKYRK